MFNDLVTRVLQAMRAGRSRGVVAAIAVSTSLTAIVAIPLAVRAVTADDDPVGTEAASSSSDDPMPAPSSPPTILPGEPVAGPTSSPTAPADLRLAVDAETLTAGSVVIHIGNDGAGAGEGAVLTLRADGATVAVIAADLPWRCDEGADHWVCAAATVGPGTRAAVVVEISAVAAGGRLEAEVRAITDDAQLVDNEIVLVADAAS